MEKVKRKNEARIIIILSTLAIVICVAVLSFVTYKYVQTYLYNQELKEMREKIEQDYAQLLSQSEKFNDDTYYTIYFNDRYLVIDKDQIIIEFK